MREFSIPALVDIRASATLTDVVFDRAGGKLILYHGGSAPPISPYGTLYYYDEVTDLAGGIHATQKFARLFMVPGMYHCGGGPGVSRSGGPGRPSREPVARASGSSPTDCGAGSRRSRPRSGT